MALNFKVFVISIIFLKIPIKYNSYNYIYYNLYLLFLLTHSSHFYLKCFLFKKKIAIIQN